MAQTKGPTPTTQLLCPSAKPEMADSTVIGVVDHVNGQPTVQYTAQALPVTDSILRLAQPVEPTEIFRFGASCAGHGCRHFDGGNCQLVSRVVQFLPIVSDGLPPCAIRSSCRWWHQEGRSACLRCPQIVSETVAPSDIQVSVAMGNVYSGQ